MNESDKAAPTHRVGSVPFQNMTEMDFRYFSQNWWKILVSNKSGSSKPLIRGFVQLARPSSQNTPTLKSESKRLRQNILSVSNELVTSIAEAAWWDCGFKPRSKHLFMSAC